MRLMRSSSHRSVTLNTGHRSLITERLRRRTFAYELKGFVHQYLTRVLTEAGAYLGVAQVYQVELRGHALRRRTGHAGQFLYESTHQGRIHRERESPCCTKKFRRRLLRRVLNDAQSLIAQQPAEALAFVPSPSLTALRQAVVRGHHAALSAIHKDTRASAFSRNSVVKRPNQVGAANASLAPYHLRMDCVIDQRRNRPPTRIQSLDDMATRIIQLLRIMVVSYFPLRLARGDFYPCRLEIGDRLMDRRRHPDANAVQILCVPAAAALPIRKSIAIWRAVRVRSADQDVLGRHVLD